MKDRKVRIWGAVFIGIVFAAAAGGYFVGFQTGTQQTEVVVIENVTGTDVPEGAEIDFNLFWEAWNILREKHIDAENVSNQDLLYGALEGLTGAFGDANTVFLKPADSERLNQDIRGNFSGIGAEIGARDGALTVVAPLKGSPAEHAGLQSGDWILEIDGESTEFLTLGEAVALIRGELGTTVTLTIQRNGEVLNVPIVRANIQVPAVQWEKLEGKFIHLELSSFTATTPFDFQNAIVPAVLGGGEGMILDLRNNPGGLLSVAVNVAGWFFEPGEVVVTEHFTSGEETMLRSRGTGALKEFPVVILINGGSASASEILAGAIRIHSGATIVGEQSFGKGTIQELEGLSDGSTLKITIANWLLPDGTLIEGNGITPDVEVPLTREDIEAGRDPQLERAIEILKQEL